MSLCASEFLRRFLQHVVPKGFMRIRHYGITANCRRKQKLARCRELLGQSPPAPDTGDRETHCTSTDARDSDGVRCPECGAPMRITEIAIPTSDFAYDTS